MISGTAKSPLPFPANKAAFGIPWHLSAHIQWRIDAWCFLNSLMVIGIGKVSKRYNNLGQIFLQNRSSHSLYVWFETVHEEVQMFLKLQIEKTNSGKQMPFLHLGLTEEQPPRIYWLHQSIALFMLSSSCLQGIKRTWALCTIWCSHRDKRLARIF